MYDLGHSIARSSARKGRENDFPRRAKVMKGAKVVRKGSKMGLEGSKDAQKESSNNTMHAFDRRESYLQLRFDFIDG
jgi:hypothetical protein